MNTDASTFSLDTAEKALKPYFHQLPFKRLNHYINNASFSEVIEGVESRFTLWLGHVTKPATLENDSMIYSIPVRRIVTTRPMKKKTRIACHDLLLERSDMGGTHGYWFLKKTTFESIADQTNVFYSTECSIVALKNKDDVAHLMEPPAYFPRTFWEVIAEWVQSSIENREKINCDLRGLLHRTSTEIRSTC